MGVKFTRRQFLNTAAVSPLFSFCSAFSESNKTEVQKRLMGRSGVRLPIIGIGGGKRFARIKNPESTDAFLNHALDNGLNYFDTAHVYAYDDFISEVRLGRVVSERRKEIFLSTKISSRGYDQFLRDVESSLRQLRTDYLDMCQIHSITSVEDAKSLGKQSGAYRALRRLQEEKTVKYSGFTGHTSAEAMIRCIHLYDFDHMLIALNHFKSGTEKFEQGVIPLAAKKGVGISVMKVIRPRETVSGLPADLLIKYALSLPHVCAAVIGMDSMEILNQNIQLAKLFEPLSTENMERLGRQLLPYFRSHELPWMQPGYTDGQLG